MSAKIVVSGNQTQKIPTEVSVKTSSYTIPAGKYARVVVECYSGGDFFINGNAALTTGPTTPLKFESGLSSLSYTVPTGYILSLGTTSASSINGVALSSNFISSGEFPGGTLFTGGTFKNVTGVLKQTNATHKEAEFILPSGTVISGSGSWRAVVEEYEE